MKIVSYDEALHIVGGVGHHYLLLGNGFSIAIAPEIFSYKALLDHADFSPQPKIKELFAALGTNDFEVVIKSIVSAAKIVEVYDPSAKDLIADLHQSAELIKTTLVDAIASRHPDRPYAIDPDKYKIVRAFLGRFGHIFTLNYDVILYWALMQTDTDGVDRRLDDGFRNPDDDSPYVSWLQMNSPKVQYLHGALHLFDAGTEIIKYTWSKTDVPIVDQIRTALNEEKYPLFVAEGTADSKKEKILHNAYLHKALRSFEGCCDTVGAALTIFGHSLADSDEHILRCVANGKIRFCLVGLYGDPENEGNRRMVAAAENLRKRRLEGRPRHPLEIIFYNAETARVWG